MTKKMKYLRVTLGVLIMLFLVVMCGKAKSAPTTLDKKALSPAAQASCNTMASDFEKYMKEQAIVAVKTGIKSNPQPLVIEPKVDVLDCLSADKVVVGLNIYMKVKVVSDKGNRIMCGVKVLTAEITKLKDGTQSVNFIDAEHVPVIPVKCK